MHALFDFKWCIRSRDIPHKMLKESQVVNHYKGNTNVTSKVGLSHTLKNLIWFNNVDIDTFFPKCYDMNNVDDYDDFKEEYKAAKV